MKSLWKKVSLDEDKAGVEGGVCGDIHIYIYIYIYMRSYLAVDNSCGFKPTKSCFRTHRMQGKKEKNFGLSVSAQIVYKMSAQIRSCAQIFLLMGTVALYRVCSTGLR